MIPVAIFLFLVGAVLAWGFRVWILVPMSLLAMTATLVVELALGTGVLATFGHGLLVGIVPQLGYAFGLFSRSALARPSTQLSSRRASVAALFKQRSVNQTH
jgi:hypothetical protein